MTAGDTCEGSALAETYGSGNARWATLLKAGFGTITKLGGKMNEETLLEKVAISIMFIAFLAVMILLPDLTM
jgi:hypothetical protein